MKNLKNGLNEDVVKNKILNKIDHNEKDNQETKNYKEINDNIQNAKNENQKVLKNVKHMNDLLKEVYIPLGVNELKSFHSLHNGFTIFNSNFKMSV